MESEISHERDDVAQENTPLLRGENNNQERADEENITSQQTSSSEINRWLFHGVAASLSLHILGLIFLIASFCLVRYGSQKFSYHDYYQFGDILGILGTGSLIVLPFTIANFILLKRYGRPLPALCNIFLFGITGIFCLWTAGIVSIDRLVEPRPECLKDLSDSYLDGRGSYKECLQWASKFQVVSWSFLTIAGLYGLVQTTLLILVIVDLTIN